MDIGTDVVPRWIWSGDDPADRHVWAWARRRFRASPGPALLEISADLRYDLWVNGRFVGFGPPRHHAGMPTVDVHDLESFIVAGENVLAVRVYSAGGLDISSCMPRRGALWARACFGEGDTFVSDSMWRMRRDPAYTDCFASRGECQPPNECYDARRALGAISSPDFPDTDWPRARELPTDASECREPRDIPFFSMQSHAPDRVIASGVLEFPQPWREVPFERVAEGLRDASARPFLPGESFVCSGGEWVLLPAGGLSARASAYAVWDLGRLWTGYPCMTLSGSAGAIVDLSYAEHLTNSRVDPAKANMNYFDRIILGCAPLEHQITWPKCARYVQITAHGGDVEAGLIWKRSTYPVLRAGGWCSDSPVLDHAVEISLHTVQLCMEDTYMDTPWRERGAWLGDDLIKAKVGYAYFGDFALARRFLLQHARGQLPSGEMQGKYPSNVTHRLSTWTLRYPDSVREFCEASGEWELARAVWPEIVHLVDWILSRKQPEGCLAAPDAVVTATVNHYNFIDWAPIDMRGANAAWNAFAWRALAASERIAAQIGAVELAEAWALEADALKENFRRVFWDSDRRVFVNGLVHGERLQRWGCHENALALLFGLANEEQEGLILERLGAENLREVFVADESDYDVEVEECGKMATVSLALSRYRWPDDRMVPVGTAYFAGFWLEMLAKFGFVAEAQDFIEERWGAFAKAGGTSVWETWDMRQSLSHGWSCVPSVLAAECFAGIERDGSSEAYTVLPSPGRLSSFQSRVATRRGILQVAFERGTLTIDAPPGLKVTAGLPAVSSLILARNGRAASHTRRLVHRGVTYQAQELPSGRSTLCLVVP